MTQINKNKKILERYAEGKGIKFIILFGSQVNPIPSSRESDFDIAVSLKNSRSIFDNVKIYSEMLENLNEILGVGIDKIDLIDLNTANILLRYEITSKGELLYGDENEYEQYKAFAFRDYFDARSLFQLEDLLIRKRQELIKEAIT